MEPIINESRQVYISKINRVQDYIEHNLEEELCVVKLAEIASFSEYHFQRIYRQITGESLYGFIKRLRLEKAIYLLRTNPRFTIQEVALSVGFSNQASFAKALKERYGVSASAIRKLKASEMTKLLTEISTNGKVSTVNMQYNKPMEVNIKTIDPIKVLYLRHTGAYKGDSDLFLMLFNKLYRYADNKGLLHEDTRWYALYHDYGDLTEEEKLRLSLCISLRENISSQGEFGCMEIAGGKYVIGSFLLEKDEYQGAWDYMISKWLPESGYMPDDRPCFEYYPPRESEEESRRAVDIFIPIIPL